MTKHSKLGASSMYRWSKCPGSVKLSEGIKSVSSSYADEGTNAHEIAAEILKNNSFPKYGRQSHDETIEAVLVYTDTVIGDAAGNEIHVEVPLDLSAIYPGCYGTSDAVVYDPISKLLRVYDYKHGQGILVEVQNNQQLMYYALGAMLKINRPCVEVEVVVVQPRANHADGPVRRWRFKYLDLIDFATDLIGFAKATEEKDAPLVTGKHCRFCPAAGFCSELGKSALSVAQSEFSPVLNYDPQKLSETLKKLDVLEAYAKSVREFAYREAQSGRPPPGFKLVEKRAQRKWKDDKVAVTLPILFNYIRNDIFETPELKSPTQIEKLLSKEDKKKLGELVVWVSSGLTLVEDSDPRQAVVGRSSPEAEFKVIKEVNKEEKYLT